MKDVLLALVEGLGWLLMAAGFGCFWAGGRALPEWFGVDRVLAEMTGIGAAVLLGGPGFAVQTFAKQRAGTGDQH